MNDERINAKISIVKRNNLLIIALVSLVFVSLKLLLNQTFITYLTEIYLLSASLFTLLAAEILKVKEDIVDERVIKKQLKIYEFGYIFTVLSGIFIYFVTCVFYLGSDFVLSANVSINLMFFLCIALSFVNIRKNNMTFNYNIIELEKKQYYKELLKNIIKAFIFFFAIALIINMLRFFNIVDNQYINAVTLSIFYSFFSMALQYFLFSIYERIHSEEIYEVYEGSYRYISRKSVFLFIVTGIYSLYYGLINLLRNYFFYMSDPLSSYYEPPGYFEKALEASLLNLILIGIIFVFLVLINRNKILKSISKVFDFKDNIVKIIKIAIWIVFAFSICNWILSVGINFRLLYLFSDNFVVRFYNYYNIFSSVYSVVSFIFIVLIFVIMYLKKINYYSLYFIVVVINLMRILFFSLLTLFEPNTVDTIYWKMFVDLIFGFIALLTVLILTLIILIRLSKKTKDIKVIEI